MGIPRGPPTSNKNIKVFSITSNMCTPPPPPTESAESGQHSYSNIWLSNDAPLPAYPGPTLPEMLGAPMAVGKGGVGVVVGVVVVSSAITHTYMYMYH